MPFFGRKEPFDGFDDLPINAEFTLLRWWTLLEDQRPWSDMLADDALGMMRFLIREVLNEARDPDTEYRRGRLIVAARGHGTFRRRQCCGLVQLEQEFETLVEALREELRLGGLGKSVVRDALLLLADDIAAARVAAVTAWRQTPPLHEDTIPMLDRPSYGEP